MAKLYYLLRDYSLSGIIGENVAGIRNGTPFKRKGRIVLCVFILTISLNCLTTFHMKGSPILLAPPCINNNFKKKMEKQKKIKKQQNKNKNKKREREKKRKSDSR